MSSDGEILAGCGRVVNLGRVARMSTITFDAQEFVQEPKAAALPSEQAQVAV
jgi:hypothetical protein